ncbi:MAG TPA: hypothetical protein VJB98_00830 [Candidatus Paceibacterota bacterium]
MNEGEPKSEKQKLENLLRLLHRAVHGIQTTGEIDPDETAPSVTTQFSTLSPEDRLELASALDECGFRENVGEAILNAVELRNKVVGRIATFAK